MTIKKAIIFGDVHGKFNSWADYIKRKVDVYDDLYNAPIFQLGDFGIWAQTLEDGAHGLKKICNNHQIYFLRGNHEEYTRKGEPFFSNYNNVIITKWFSDFKHVPVFIEGYKEFNDALTLWVGGAFSVDYRYRKEGKTWWSVEELPDKELINRHIQLDKVPKIIMTHDAPETFVNRYMDKYVNEVYAPDGTKKTGSSELNILYNAYQPVWWFFGHYHIDLYKIDECTSTKFFCFPTFNNGFGVYNFETNDLTFNFK